MTHALLCVRSFGRLFTMRLTSDVTLLHLRNSAAELHRETGALQMACLYLDFKNA